MRKLRFRALAAMIAVVALVGAACASDEEPPADGGGGGGSASADAGLLGEVQSEGVLTVSTDPAYPPQSSLNEETGEYEGFDIDVATEIAKRMGVEIAWETPAWDVITAGGWNDRWDVSVGSMTVTAERAEVLNFTTPYYYTPAGLAVQTGSSIASLDDLSGAKVGVCGACTYEFYLRRDLNIDIPGFTFEYLVPEDIEIVTYDTDSTAIQDLEIGRIDAAMSAVPTLQGAIDKGRDIQLLGDPVFYEPLAAALDKSSSLDSSSLTDEIAAIIEEMHTDGTLTQLSEKWYGEDLTQNPAG
jgi:polar amino acid transport system substrate-binding protein